MADEVINDAALAGLRTAIGQTQRVRGWNNEVSQDAVMHFASGVGDDNPLWWQPDHALGTLWKRPFAMPSFLYSCNNGYDPYATEPVLNHDAFLPGALALWVSDSWTWHRPAYVGTRIAADNGLAAIIEHEPGRRPGRSVTQIERTTFRDAERGDIIAEYDLGLRRFEPAPAAPSTTAPVRTEPCWSESDREMFRQHYLSERRRGAETRWIDGVQAGDELGKMLKGPLTRSSIIGWLMGWGSTYTQTNRMLAQYLDAKPGARSVNREWGAPDTIEAPHWERGMARDAGISSGYDFGGQRAAWMIHFLTDWAGDDGFLHALEVRFTGMNLLGDIVWITGRVEAVAPGNPVWNVECSIVASNQNGQVVAAGKAKILLPHKS